MRASAMPMSQCLQKSIARGGVGCPASLRFWWPVALALLLWVGGAAAIAQSSGSAAPVASAALPAFAPIAEFAMLPNEWTIRRGARANEPFTVAGERGAILGQQDGSFELWALPVKMLANFRITAQLADYPVPIDLNQQAATIEVAPDHTTITYAHAAIVVKQTMFIPRAETAAQTRENLAAVVYFEIHAIRPAVLTFSFEPSMVEQWPAPSYGPPSASWTRLQNAQPDGFYTLATNDPKLFGIVAMPGAEPGILPPYQEKPASYPLEFRLHFDPAKDADKLFPLLAAVSNRAAADPEHEQTAMLDRLIRAGRTIEQQYRATADFYAHYFDRRLLVETPDARFNEALAWSEIAVEQAKVRSHPQDTENLEAGLVAGWFSSGSSARPGYGWFFGRDAMWSLYAVNSSGDFGLARQELDFLIKRQRADGKIMHEYSQTAELVDWAHMPYEYAAADSSPLFVLAMEDFVRSSGDVAYLKANWAAVTAAYRFTRANTSNGVLSNAAGTGWVESWPPTMPHQEMYLAALDQQSAEAFSRMAAMLHDVTLRDEAAATAAAIRRQLDTYHEAEDFYAFSRNADLTLDTTSTIFPAVAWWSGRLNLPRAGAMFRAWSSSAISTDWGARSVADTAAQYDPISYHQGTVWPLFTGWLAMADYRTGRALSGQQHLLENVDLTWMQDLGAATELLSGAFDQPLGRSSSHQLWSSAMIEAPAIRGLFGVEVDAVDGNLRVAPHLPAEWSQASLHHVAYRGTMLDVSLRRSGATMHVEVTSPAAVVMCLDTPSALNESAKEVYFSDRPCTEAATRRHAVDLPLPLIEVGLSAGDRELGGPGDGWAGDQPGDSTHGLKVLDERYGERRIQLTLSAPASSHQRLMVRRNTLQTIPLRIEGGALEVGDQDSGAGAGREIAVGIGRDVSAPTTIGVDFAGGVGYQTKVITLSW